MKNTTTFDHVFRSIFTPNWMAALVLSACFYLQLAKGYSEDVIYPYAMAAKPISDLPTWNPIAWIVACANSFWLARPYLYGLFLAFVLVTCLVISGLRLMGERSHPTLSATYVFSGQCAPSSG